MSTSPKQLSREFRLTALCVRWPRSEVGQAAIRRIVDEGADWVEFGRMVERHRVAGLVQAAVAEGLLTPPPETATRIAQRAAAITRQNQRMDEEAARLQRLFDAASIPLAFLKGSSLAQLVYGTTASKHGRDIDILTPPDRADNALRLLEEAGYALHQPAKRLSPSQRSAVFRHGREIELVKPGARLLIELHWRLADNPRLLGDGDVWTSTRLVPVAGFPIRTLGDADLFAYLCVHGAMHAWSRLKWLADFNAFLGGRSEEDVAALYHHAAARGAGLCAGQALLLCRDVLELRLSSALEAALDRTRLRSLQAAALRAMCGPDPAAELARRRLVLAYRAYLGQLRLGEGWGYLGGQLRVMSVSVRDVVAVPLPPTLDFLYPAMRLPMWLGRMASRPGA